MKINLHLILIMMEALASTDPDADGNGFIDDAINHSLVTDSDPWKSNGSGGKFSSVLS